MSQRTKMIFALLALFIGITVSADAAFAQQATTGRVFYVSKAAQSATPDGRSWSTAWPEMDKIVWSRIRPGDTIMLGNNIYRTTLSVQASGTAALPIKIVAASDPNFPSSQLYFRGGQGQRVAIDVGNSRYVHIIGPKGRLLIVNYFLEAGVRTGPLSYGIRLKNMILQSNSGSVGQFGADPKGGYGVLLQGQNHVCEQLTVEDNGTNILAAHNGNITLSRCLIGNAYDYRTTVPAGLVVAGPTTAGTRSTVTVSDCVFNTKLSSSLQVAKPRTDVRVRHSLFVNPLGTAIEKRDPSSTIQLSNITSVMTPMTRYNTPHSCLTNKVRTGGDTISNSIFYGGIVDVAGSTPFRGINSQFKTSGNTLVLGNRIEDPKFVTDVAALGNDPYNLLWRGDFSLRLGSPSAGLGSRMTSISKLFSMDN